ncbi:receptor-interacting serine/threonine-protein kinase 4-like [Strongylocentrotus purpuratus]|uniref:Uncharacterized protein n=1 Tax=Strongylocentrotus purpuratus TaxID=7668 RepID=A0A7M7PDT3_STRPU|nr:receptor-interacting serine/threonine-protein kinase 4-like [Strongylocentrotus purpuratus]
MHLVKAENPSINKAKDLLSDFTPDEIRQAIEQKDAIGNSVIHYACAKALVPWVELLIYNRADFNVAGEGGQTPIHFAVKGENKNVSQVKDRVTVVKLLIKEKVPADKKDYHGRTPLQLACDVKGQHKVIRALLSVREIDVNQDVKTGTVTSSLFHITCQNDQFENAQVLLKHRADPLAKDSLRGDTPFHIILRKGQVKFALRFLKICKENRDVVREILLAQNAYQQSVLHEAVKCGDKELVSYCLEYEY